MSNTFMKTLKSEHAGTSHTSKGSLAYNIDGMVDYTKESAVDIEGALVYVLSILANTSELNLVLAKSQVILVGKEIDITDKAVAELNKVLPKISLKE